MNRMLNNNNNNNNYKTSTHDSSQYDPSNHNPPRPHQLLHNDDDQTSTLITKHKLKQVKQETETEITAKNIPGNVDRSRLMAITDMNAELNHFPNQNGGGNHHHHHHDDEQDDVDALAFDNDNNVTDCSTRMMMNHDDGHQNIGMVVDAADQCPPPPPPPAPPLSVINDFAVDDDIDIKDENDDKIKQQDNPKSTINPKTVARQKSTIIQQQQSSITTTTTSSRRFDMDTMDNGHAQKRYSTESTDSSSIIQRLLDKIENLEYELKLIKQERDALYSENERLCFQLQMINEADKHQQRSKRPQSSISSAASSIMAPVTGNTLIQNQYPLTKSMSGVVNVGVGVDGLSGSCCLYQETIEDNHHHDKHCTGIQDVSDMVDDMAAVGGGGGTSIECPCHQYQSSMPLMLPATTLQQSSTTAAESLYHRCCGGTTTTASLYTTTNNDDNNNNTPPPAQHQHHHPTTSCLPGQGAMMFGQQQQQQLVNPQQSQSSIASTTTNNTSTAAAGRTIGNNINNNNNNLSTTMINNKANNNNSSSSSSSSYSANTNTTTTNNMDVGDNPIGHGIRGGGGGDSFHDQPDDDPTTTTVKNCQCNARDQVMIGHHHNHNHNHHHNHLVRSQSTHGSFGQRSSLNMSTTMAIKLSPTMAAASVGGGFFDATGDNMMAIAGGHPNPNHHNNHHHHGGLSGMQSGSNLVRTSRTTGGSSTSLASNSNSAPYNCYEISQQLLDKKVSALERKYGGKAAREAAIKIQRSYRSYRLTKRFRSFVSHAAKQQQMLKQQQITGYTTRMMMRCCPESQCHHHHHSQMDHDFGGYGPTQQQPQQQLQSSYSHHHPHPHHLNQQQQPQYQPRQLVNQIHNYYPNSTTQPTATTQQTMMMMMSGMNITDGIGYESGMMYSQRAPSIMYAAAAVAHPSNNHHASPLAELDGAGAYGGSNNSLAGTGMGGGGGGKRLQKKTSFSSSTSSTGSSSSLHAVVPAGAVGAGSAAVTAASSLSSSSASSSAAKQISTSSSSNAKMMSKDLTGSSTVVSTGGNGNHNVGSAIRNSNPNPNPNPNPITKHQQHWQSQHQLSSNNNTSTTTASSSLASMQPQPQPQQQQSNQINRFRITKQYSSTQCTMNNNNGNNNGNSNIIHYNTNIIGGNNNINSDHYAASAAAAAATNINPIITSATTTAHSMMINHNQQQQQQSQHHHYHHPHSNHCHTAANSTMSTGSGTTIMYSQHGQQHGQTSASSMSNVTTNTNTTNESVSSSSVSMQMNNSGSNVSGSVTGQAGAAGSTATSASSDAHRKRLYRVGLNLFNKNPSERGIRFLIQHNFIEQFTTMDEQAKSVAIFLLTRKGVSRQMIGEYLADLPPFNKQVLKAYVMEINLQGLIVDEALRSFQVNFRFPGEAQKIERLVEAFADRYKECNPDDVLSRDSIFILAFAIIMLNTDLHKPTNIKHRMTPEQWLANLKGVFSEGDLSAQFLLNVYKRIKKQELQTGPDHSTQVMKVQSTMVGKDVPNLCVPHRRLVCYCRLYEIRDVNRKEKVGQHQRDVFLFNDLLLITKTTNRSRNQLAEYQYRSSTSLDGLHVNTFSKGFYAHGIRISRRVDQKVLALFNARNELDQKRFVEDLRESILEMDEMEQIRITKSSSLVQLNNFTIGPDFGPNTTNTNANANATAAMVTDVVGIQRQQSKTNNSTNYTAIHGKILDNDENSSIITENPNSNHQSQSSSSLSSNVPGQDPLNGHHTGHHHHHYHHFSSASNLEQPITTNTNAASASSAAGSSSTSSTTIQQ